MPSLNTSSPRFSRSSRTFSPFFAVTPILAMSLASVVTGCSHAWEEYDPRVTSTSGGSSSSSSSGSSGGSSKCGGTSVLVSDFDKGDLQNLWEINEWGGATISETAGELVAKLPMNSGEGCGAYVTSKYLYDFREDFVSIEVPRTANVDNASWTALSVGPNENNYIEIFQEGSTINFGMKVDGMYSKLLSIPYEATPHRFWQMRESAGRVYYETSPDGQTWTGQTDVSIMKTLFLEYSRIYMASGSNPDQTNPGEAHFDRLNAGGIPKQNYCPTSSLRDDFADGMRGDQWLRSWEGQPGMLGENGGQFVIQYPPNIEAYAGLVSASAFDLAGSSVVVEVLQAPATSVPAHTAITLNGPGDNDLDMFVEEGTLKLGAKTNGNYQDIATKSYSPIEHRWWRIREEDNTIYWETAPDGKTWTTQLERNPSPVPGTIFDIEFHAGVWSPTPMPGECRLDNLNLPPQ